MPAGIDTLTVETTLFIGDTTEFDDDGNDVLPEAARLQNVEYGYHPEQFQDVGDLAFEQKPEASTEEIVRCLNHYAERDCFLDLN